jgi:hypothetical protein
VCAWGADILKTIIYNYWRLRKIYEVEQNIVIYQWRADQLFADAEGRGK